MAGRSRWHHGSKWTSNGNRSDSHWIGRTPERGRPTTTACPPRGDRGGRGMGLFEQYPWLLVPIIVITIEGWSALKLFARGMMRQRRRNRDVAKELRDRPDLRP